MTQVIAPCPFCGMVPSMRDTKARMDDGLWFVLMHSCDSLKFDFLLFDESYDDLVERWNARADARKGRMEVKE